MKRSLNLEALSGHKNCLGSNLEDMCENKESKTKKCETK